ncbi:MAG: hypothetical protein ACM30I_00900 [Gemmatimonas sp.]
MKKILVKKIIALSTLATFVGVMGAVSARAQDSWADSARITPSGASSVASIDTLVPSSYDPFKDE